MLKAGADLVFRQGSFEGTAHRIFAHFSYYHTHTHFLKAMKVVMEMSIQVLLDTKLLQCSTANIKAWLALGKRGPSFEAMTVPLNLPLVWSSPHLLYLYSLHYFKSGSDSIAHTPC